MKALKNFSSVLPQDKLISRYKSMFDSLLLGNSATAWGFPVSCDFAYLRYVFSQKALLSEIFPISPSNRLVLFLDFDSLPEMNTLSFHKHLLYQISNLIKNAPIQHSSALNALLNEVPNLLRTDDAYTMFQYCIKILAQTFRESPVKVTLVIHDLNIDTWDESWGRNLYRLWHIHRIHPDVRMSFYFATKPYPTPADLPPFLKPLRMAYYESVSVVPLFDREESMYTLSRHEIFYNTPIPQSVKEQIYLKLGGYSEFYIPVIQLIKQYGIPKKSAELEKLWFTNESIRYYIKFLFTSLPQSTRSELINFVNGKPLPKQSIAHKLNILPLPDIWKFYITKLHTETEKKLYGVSTTYAGLALVEPLTGSEHEVLTLLIQHANTLVTKDMMFQCVWGENENAYSDWAIDKLVSRLRSKISSPRHINPLLTLRGKGYKLIL